MLGTGIFLRSVSLASSQLGIYGRSDAIQLFRSDDDANTITHPRYPGRYRPYPIEYKRGKPKKGLCDIMQLVAQVMCLEEMYNIEISKAALFYWQPMRRMEVAMTDELRENARHFTSQMHLIFDSGILPAAKFSPKCNNCSLRDLCMPSICNGEKSVNKYLIDNLYEEAT